MNPRLPGLPTISALMLAAMIAVALGLVGPFHLETLKDWQTLLASMIAPSIALVAAFVAYKGAMAKVEFDRSIHIKTEQRFRRNLLKKTAFSAAIFLSHVNDAERRLNPGFSKDQDFILSSILVELPQDLEDAWNNLELFDGEIAKCLANVRLNTEIVRAEVDRLGRDSEWRWTWLEKPPAKLQPIMDATRDLHKFTNDLTQHLLPHWGENHSPR